jgi:hypothetical protein
MINRLVYTLVAILVISSCNDNDIELKKSIIGTWDVFSSEINNKPNGLMKNGWFAFADDQTVKSNIFEGNNSEKYNVDNGRLIIDGKEKFDLKISRLENDTMHLVGKVKVYNMEYFLVRRG